MLSEIFSALEDAGTDCEVHGTEPQPPALRLLTLLADGTDHLAAELALAKAWELTVPLPFGRALNTAINADPDTAADPRAILAGRAPDDAPTGKRAAAIEALLDKATVFELAERDAIVADHFLATLDNPSDPKALSTFLHHTSDRTLQAGRILIEQSDILIAVWDGVSTTNIGGTGHTAIAALSAGVPVIWIDPASPDEWRIVYTPDALALKPPPTAASRDAQLRALVGDSVGLAAPDEDSPHAGLAALGKEAWRGRSSASSHAYRRVEALFGHSKWREKFGSIRQTFEAPDEVATGSGQPLLDSLDALPGGDERITCAIGEDVLSRFAWTNAIASRLSDLFRSGMVLNFTLGPLAILVGLLYIPTAGPEYKWIFAALELLLLLVIVVNTLSGQRARLHARWLETRRLAEYLRHAPGLLALGVARPVGGRPQSVRGSWPEWYARQVARGVGLPNVKVDGAYLRASARLLLDHAIQPQLEYHQGKSARLHRAHHAIETLAERLFALAVIMVTLYLVLFGLSTLGVIAPELVTTLAKWFTVSAVALPTIAGALAAIGYFGDFDRFADISEMTARRLEALQERTVMYLEQSDDALGYAPLAQLARQTDETTFAEIQAWQAVFNNKRTTVPA
ncbi:hypothetical protein [Erythrobacter crassostreae]|uniref:SMODS and SLOG-associating 2TM effector domain-containing protein n=1 Tax=Erythrobacter crassostreae TaxID=2828328 RepID=A0A9X1F4X4_9SPHN|nr:hypothetical protein [Erythrobacter crassostrea]MBV7259398.1 hypothetical protein [Erythrobacter crassostrea]